MSLILDALNKADRERQNAEMPPGINTEHEVPRVVKRPVLSPYVLAAVIFALVIIVLAGYFFFSTTKSQDTDNPESISAISTEESPVDVPEAPKSRRSSTTIPGLPKPMHVKNPNAPKPAQRAEVTTTQDTESVKSLYQEKTSTQTTTAVTPVTTVTQNEDVQAPAEKTPTNTLSAYSSTMTMSELPWSIQKNIPTLRYTGHSYVEGGRSRIVINDEAKREGDKLAGNVVIDKILVDGLILHYENYSFKLSALNSWINF